MNAQKLAYNKRRLAGVQADLARTIDPQLAIRLQDKIVYIQAKIAYHSTRQNPVKAKVKTEKKVVVKKTTTKAKKTPEPVSTLLADILAACGDAAPTTGDNALARAKHETVHAL
jgi:hypothetical protein